MKLTKFDIQNDFGWDTNSDNNEYASAVLDQRPAISFIRKITFFNNQNFEKEKKKRTEETILDEKKNS